MGDVGVFVLAAAVGIGSSRSAIAGRLHNDASDNGASVTTRWASKLVRPIRVSRRVAFQDQKRPYATTAMHPVTKTTKTLRSEYGP